MILLETGEIRWGERVTSIVRWEVWFQTVKGMHPTLGEALEMAALADMPADLIRAIPVAIGEDGAVEPRG